MTAWLDDPRLYRLFALAWMGVIFVLSSRPSAPVPNLFPHQDLLFHFFAFSLLGVLVTWGGTGPWFEKRGLRLIVVTLIVGLYGFADEFHQAFVPGRNATLIDAFADVLGGLTAALITRPVTPQQ